jgi:carnitine O-acetyltransferase
MAVKTFTRPTSLDGKLATVPEQHTMSQTNGSPIKPERSADAAKEVTQTFSKDEKSPIAQQNDKSKPGITFAAQDKLPKLPIPELESSMNKYLSALTPLQSAKEHRDSEAAVKEFLRSDGQKLQEKLKEYASGRANYIEQFCKSCR